MMPFEELEHKWAEFCGCNPENVVGCSTGTSALHLAFEAMQLRPYSPVLVPELTMIACARAVAMAGLSPEFVDCGDDLLIDTKLIKSYVTRYTSAIMPVHIYGRRCNMEVISGIAKDYKLRVVEDLAEAHGVKHHPNTDAACWSMYRNKIIAGEEGGIVVFKELKHAELARQLRSNGFVDPSAHNFIHIPRCNNYRMSNAHADLILKSLSFFEENSADRRQIEEWYDVKIPSEWKMPSRDVVWVYDLRISGLQADQQAEVVQTLMGKKIAARHAFQPMSAQPEFAKMYKHLNAYRLGREVIYMPVQPGMTEATVSHYADELKFAVDAALLKTKVVA